MKPIEITSENFEDEVIKTSVPVLLDFWATWCGPCRMVSPVVDQIAEEQGDALKVGKINVDDEQELAAKFNVSAIPTLVVMLNGKEVRRNVGALPKKGIEDLIKG